MNRRILEVVLAVVAGAAIVAVGFTVAARSDADDTQQQTASTTPPASQPPTTAPADVDAFLDAWRASRQIDVVVVGEQQTVRVDPSGGVDPLRIIGEVTGSIEMRYVRLGDRRTEQVGTSALVTDESGQRSCDLMDGQYLCTDPTPASTLDQEMIEFTDRLVGDDAPYDLFDDAGLDDDDRCWRAVAVEPSPVLRWGQVSVWCFDADTGALARTARWKGDDLVQRFDATEIRSEVESSDLDPQ